MLNIHLIRSITLARHLYELGLASAKSNNDMHLFSAVNLLQDAVEAFLAGVAIQVDANLNQNTSFDQYFVKINEKITPSNLPFKTQLMRLNQMRVGSKHHGVQPDRSEVARMVLVVYEFFEQVCAKLFDASFFSVCTLDLLNDSDSKKLITEAKDALESNQYLDCAVYCRKAIFLELECQYDISAYNNGIPGLLNWPSRAPEYARSKEYIEEYVLDPTDYVVYDQNEINQHLLELGVDNTAFWNVARLTPAVYRSRFTDKWIVKNDLAKTEEESLKNNIEYIFSSTLDILLSIHKFKQAQLWTKGQHYSVKLNKQNVSVYKKASNLSGIVATTPAELKEITSYYSISGLDDDANYWYVTHYENGASIRGFIHEVDVDTSEA